MTSKCNKYTNKKINKQKTLKQRICFVLFFCINHRVYSRRGRGITRGEEDKRERRETRVREKEEAEEEEEEEEEVEEEEEPRGRTSASFRVQGSGFFEPGCWGHSWCLTVLWQNMKWKWPQGWFWLTVHRGGKVRRQGTRQPLTLHLQSRSRRNWMLVFHLCFLLYSALNHPVLGRHHPYLG